MGTFSAVDVSSLQKVRLKLHSYINNVVYLTIYPEVDLEMKWIANPKKKLSVMFFFNSNLGTLFSEE